MSASTIGPGRLVRPALVVDISPGGHCTFALELRVGTGVTALTLDEANDLARDLPAALSYLVRVAEAASHHEPGHTP